VLTGIIQVYIVTCDRWGYGCSCKHGGYYTSADRYNPGMYIVTCDRWGYGCSCKHGGYFTCADRYNPGMYSYLLQMRVYCIRQCSPQLISDLNLQLNILQRIDILILI
jgi:hypothetical protein